MEAALPRDSARHQLYPVSVAWAPPFTMLVDLVGHGDPQVTWTPHNERLAGRLEPLFQEVLGCIWEKVPGDISQGIRGSNRSIRCTL